MLARLGGFRVIYEAISYVRTSLWNWEGSLRSRHLPSISSSQFLSFFDLGSEKFEYKLTKATKQKKHEDANSVVYLQRSFIGLLPVRSNPGRLLPQEGPSF